MDGEKASRIEPTAQLIQVNDFANLIINDGTELFNNNASKKYGPLNDVTGGAISSRGNITMNGGHIHDNDSAMGGGIYQSKGTFEMKGGIIENNHAVDKDYYIPIVSTIDYLHSGGGVLLAYGAQMNMTGGVIRNNIADDDGGGISLGNGHHEFVMPKYPDYKKVTLHLSGGDILNNEADRGGRYLCTGLYYRDN